jgi:hypothetical protein
MGCCVVYGEHQELTLKTQCLKTPRRERRGIATAVGRRMVRIAGEFPFWEGEL